jgi:lysophospholipase L1-like esterase
VIRHLLRAGATLAALPLTLAALTAAARHRHGQLLLPRRVDCLFPAAVYLEGIRACAAQRLPGSQLDAALAFLAAHRGKVSPITLSLNGNDINEFLQSCPSGDLACIAAGAPAAIAAYQARLTSILTRLRTATPDAEIIVVGAYDPNLGAFAFADPLFTQLNQAQQAAAATVRARFADPFPVFNPQGDAAIETAAIGTLTLLCTEGDGHPSDAGYRALADIVWAASGYASLR